MSEPELVELIERLRRKVRRFPAHGGGTISSDGNATSYTTDDGYRLVNPDGPAAADALERLSRSDVTEDEVERVARELYEQGIVEREIAPAVARAAIAAMRSAQRDGGRRPVENARK